LPVEKAKLYLDYLERAYIRGYYLKNLISFCANSDSLVKYIEKEIQIERGLNLPYHDKVP
jgi:dTDP-D-glucose 4,6-dehydratase